jgi:hypothetical protein
VPQTRLKSRRRRTALRQFRFVQQPLTGVRGSVWAVIGKKGAYGAQEGIT